MSVDVSIVVGTRPEAIKCAPVIFALRDRGLNVRIVASGQHAELLDNALATFELKPDVNLKTMSQKPDLTALTARLISALGDELAAHSPRVVLVQGDTTTTLAASLASFYAGIPCAHIEAGLRSGRLDAPWPEEMNRLIVDRLCARHYPPTSAAREALLAEGIQPDGILVSGQTGVDAALSMAAKIGDEPPGNLSKLLNPQPAKLAYVTAHRRENQQGGIRNIVLACVDALEARPGLVVVLAAHPSPHVRTQLDGVTHEHLKVVEPLSYAESIWMIAHSDCVVSDSGGIQEEAPSFGTPVLVTRDVTERPEGVTAGFLQIVGTDREKIADKLIATLADHEVKNRLKQIDNPYGDGHASQRIADDIQKLLNS